MKQLRYRQRAPDGVQVIWCRGFTLRMFLFLSLLAPPGLQGDELPTTILLQSPVSKTIPEQLLIDHNWSLCLEQTKHGLTPTKLAFVGAFSESDLQQIQQFRHLKTVHLQGGVPLTKKITSTVSGISSIQKLTLIGNFNRLITNEKLKTESLDFRSLRKMKSLHFLELRLFSSSEEEPTTKQILQLPESFDSLKELKINCRTLSKKNIQTISEYRQLQSLTINVESDLPNQGLNDIAAGNKKLSNLTIIGGLSVGTPLSALKKLKQLRSLTVLGGLRPSKKRNGLKCHWIKMHGTELQELKNLQKLTLKGCVLNNKCVQVLAGLPELEELTIDNCVSPTCKPFFPSKEQGVLNKTTAFAKLKIFNIAHSRAFPTTQLLNKSSKTIRELRVIGTGPITGLGNQSEIQLLDLHRAGRFEKNISQLGILGNSVTVHSELFKEIIKLKKLNSFSSNGIDFDGDALNKILSIKSLQKATFTSTGINKKQMLENRFANVGEVTLDHSEEVILQSISPKSLEKLLVSNYKGTDLSSQPDLPKLRCLSIGPQKSVSNECLAWILKQVALEELNLSSINFPDTKIAKLSLLPRLRVLNLAGVSNITDTGIAQLASMKNLKELILSETKITILGVRKLSAQRIWVGKKWPNIDPAYGNLFE